MSVVRISKGTFPPEKFELIKIKMEQSKELLAPALTKLNGLINFYAAIDVISNSTINASIWETLEDAKQLDTLAPMLKLAGEFIELGVNFERPIINFTGLWDL